MKRTTYIIIALLVATLLLVGAGCLTVVHYAAPYTDNQIGMLDDDHTDIPLPKFAHLTFTNNDWQPKIKGITIVESDSVDTPIVQTGKNWEKYFECNLVGDTLAITGNYPKNLRIDRQQSKDKWLATIIVPRGMIRGVTNNWRTLRLIDIQTPQLNVESNRKVILIGCNIDRLSSLSDSLEELKLENTHIEIADIRQVNNELDIMCTDSTSVINRMQISDSRRSGDSHLNLLKANIGSMTWQPVDTTAEINIVINKPAEIKF